MGKFFGKVLHMLATGIGHIFNFLINVINVIVMTFEGIRQLLLFVLLIGCSTFFFVPIFALALPREWWYVIFSIIIIPILGPKFVSLLRYGNYTITEWMYDRADSLITGKKVGYDSFSDYSNKYKFNMENEKRRREEEAARAYQEEMNKRFEEMFRGFSGSYYQTGNSYNDYNNQNTYSNVNNVGFKEKYEKSLAVLGLDTSADIYQVKLNYRKLAKKYHPDINKDPNATEMFTKVNDAYEFLSEDNIKKYKNTYK